MKTLSIFSFGEYSMLCMKRCNGIMVVRAPVCFGGEGNFAKFCFCLRACLRRMVCITTCFEQLFAICCRERPNKNGIANKFDQHSVAAWPTFSTSCANFFKREYQCTIPSAISSNDVIACHFLFTR